MRLPVLDFGRRLQASERRRRKIEAEPVLARLARMPGVYWEWQKRQGTNAGAVARKVEWFILAPWRRA